MAPGMSKARKFAIQYFLVEKFSAPAEGDWDAPNFHPTCSLPTVLMSVLDIPSGSRVEVVTAMRAILAAHSADVLYDPSVLSRKGVGQNQKSRI